MAEIENTYKNLAFDKIVTISNFSEKYHEAKVIAKDFLELYTSSSNHRLVDNYSNIDFNQLNFITLVYKGDKVVGFSSGWDRPDFYPKNTVRVGNRFCMNRKESPESLLLRKRSAAKFITMNLLEQQATMAKELGFDFAFTSREYRTTKTFKLFHKKVENAKGQFEWEFRKGPFLVAPDPNSDRCWQNIMMTKIGEIDADYFWSHWREKECIS